MKQLTDRQQEIYTFIVEYWSEHGRSPVAQEIADEFSMYPTGARDHCDALKRKGYLENVKGTRNLIPSGLRQHITSFFASRETTCQ